MSKPAPPTYRTTNWHSYNAALRERGSLSIWFDPKTQWLAARFGLAATLFGGLALQIAALVALAQLEPGWGVAASVTFVMACKACPVWPRTLPRCPRNRR